MKKFIKENYLNHNISLNGFNCFLSVSYFLAMSAFLTYKFVKKV